MTTSKATPWQPGPAVVERSRTPAIEVSGLVVAAGTVMLRPLVGAPGSTLMFELAH